MLRHVAVFVFTPEFAENGLDDWIESVARLADVIPEVQALSIGRNVVDGGNAWQVAIVADFEDRAGLEAYNVHSSHLQVREISGPVKERLAIVDFEIDVPTRRSGARA
jgi:hypothetical protein